MIDLHILWFILLGILMTGYAILDGFDFGVGMLHFIAKTDEERRTVINSIGPIWDGNEVWLVTFGGALFAAFPEAYATILSGFYIAFMAILFALILRAVSLEFRSKFQNRYWRTFWDGAFTFASFLASMLFGVGVGAAMLGVPLDNDGLYVGGIEHQLKPYTLLVGLMTTAMFTMHGAIFLRMKTEGALKERARRWMWRGFGLFLITYLMTTIATLVNVDHATDNFQNQPWAWGIVLLNILAIANIPRSIYKDQPMRAFLSSCVTIASLVFLLGLALFPNLVRSLPANENSLTIYNSASSETTLQIMTVIAGIGMPFVITYTGIVYWTFRGKVQLDKHSY